MHSLYAMLITEVNSSLKIRVGELAKKKNIIDFIELSPKVILYAAGY